MGDEGPKLVTVKCKDCGKVLKTKGVEGSEYLCRFCYMASGLPYEYK